MSSSTLYRGLAGEGARAVAPPGEAVETQTLDAAFRHEHAGLLRYFDRRVGRDDAPDLVQEVYLRAAGSGLFSRVGNPAGFLRRVAQNLLIDRSRRARFRGVELLLDEAQGVTTPAEQEMALDEADLLRMYELALNALPPKTRRVFIMHRVEELTYREIHEQLGISMATVEYHMMKALAHLARALDVAR